MTLYISNTDIIPRKSVKLAFIYLLVAILCGIFGAVYELFSHEFYSLSMIYAFAYPLVGGTLPFLAMGIFKCTNYPGILSQNLYHSEIATITVENGILEIYGTTNILNTLYHSIGIVFCAIGVIVYFIQFFSYSKGRNNQ